MTGFSPSPLCRLSRSLCGFGLLLAGVAAQDSSGDPAVRPPNVLILYADDLGFGDLGCQNPDSKIPTPRLDQLARGGLRFTDGHSSASICTPSRYALLTGRYHWRDFHGIVGPMGGSVFRKEQQTLPEMMRSCGYRTACIGKWHLGWDWQAIRRPDARPIQRGRRKVFGPEAYDWTLPVPDGPLAHGFDSYFGDTVINFPPYAWIENDRLPRAPDAMLDVRKWKKIKEGNWECRPGPMRSDWDPYQNIPTTTRRGVDFIRSQKGADKPFFLYFTFPSPHAPIIPNDAFDGKSEAGAYGDFVYETDQAAGRLLDALDEAGLAENTIVIFTADNGPEHYAYPRDRRHGHWSAAPFRGLKRDLYEGGHHVPFVVRWPGVTRPGTTNPALVSQIDLYATLMDMLGREIPRLQAIDSRSFLPVLLGEAPRARSSLIHCSPRKQFAVRQGDWLLVMARNGYVSKVDKAWERRRGYPADDGQAVELYNLAKDIGQRANLAETHPEKVQELQAELLRVRRSPASPSRRR